MPMRIFSVALSLSVIALAASAAIAGDLITTGDESVFVELIEACKNRDWSSATAAPTQVYREPVMAFIALPRRYSAKGVIADRSPVFLLRAAVTQKLSAGEYRFVVRAVSGSRLLMDDRLIAQTDFVKPYAEGHESVPSARPAITGVRPLPAGHQERTVTVSVRRGVHRFRFEVLVGCDKMRQEIGQPGVAIARAGEPFTLLAGDRGPNIPLTDEAWDSFQAEALRRLRLLDLKNRRRASEIEDIYWQHRHERTRAVMVSRPKLQKPPAPSAYPEHNLVDRFINRRLSESTTPPTALTNDEAFLRRVTLDTIGILPTSAEIAAFHTDRESGRRQRAINRLIANDRWADNWVGYWQDVLAENPGILKPELNNTGPFRWWIHEAFLDNKPMDRFATELITMEGSVYYGGPAGFAIASQNDAPLADKAHVIAKAFLGLEMKCARCHDAPYHPFKQKDLFGLAAMLDNRPVKLPKSSTVSGNIGGRKPLVQTSLKPGESIDPHWPFVRIADDRLDEGVVRNPVDFRERFAAIVTSPQNDRFAKVMVNRIWKRYLGAGLVEPVDDWNETKASHPKLLEWLSRELVEHDYDLKHVARLILNSHVYQREPAAEPAAAEPENRLFAGPLRRRMSAEQVLDSLFAAVEKPLRSEMLTMDPEVRRGVAAFQNFGSPTRAWQFTSLSNERDRPALAFPVAQSFVDMLTAFGWRDSRSFPISVREEDSTPLQPLTLGNGILGNRIVRLSDDSALTELAMGEKPVENIVEALFLRFLSRAPTESELNAIAEFLRPGYDNRCVPGAKKELPRNHRNAVSWSNHLSPEASRIKLEMEREVREGDPPTKRLKPEWRERLEDAAWALVNSPEFVFIP